MTSGIFPEVGLGPTAYVDSVPLKRAGTEEVRPFADGCIENPVRRPTNVFQEMAGAILFLASRAGAYVNGAVWLVDGGRIGSVPSSH